MVHATTPNPEGRTSTGYLGVVTGAAIAGANILRTFLPVFGTLQVADQLPMR